MEYRTSSYLQMGETKKGIGQVPDIKGKGQKIAFFFFFTGTFDGGNIELGVRLWAGRCKAENPYKGIYTLKDLRRF